MTLGEALLSNLGGTSANSLTHILELNNVEENSDNQNLILQESPYRRHLLRPRYKRGAL